MRDDDAASVLRRFLEEVWNARKLDAFPDHVAPDVRFHPPRGPERDHAAYRQMAAEFQRAFSDLHFEIERIDAHGDHASARLWLEGTHDGPWRGRAPTGKRMRVVGQPQCSVRNGKIVEFWQLYDELDMMQQLGLRE